MVLLINGSGALGREIYDLADRNNDGRWEEIVFVNEYDCEKRRLFYGTYEMPLHEAVERYSLDQVEGIVAVGEPSLREKLHLELKQYGVKLATLIDRTAIVSKRAKVGEGSIICEFTTIHVDVKIGENVLIQPYCDIGHDIEIGNHTVLSPFCAPGGECRFGDRVFVGMQATIRQGLSIGDNAIISMGAAVFQNVAPYSTMVGNPARVTKGNSENKVFQH